MDINDIKQLGDQLRAQMAKVIVGQAETVDLMLVALFSGGHILLEGPPALPRLCWRSVSPAAWGWNSAASSSPPT